MSRKSSPDACLVSKKDGSHQIDGLSLYLFASPRSPSHLQLPWFVFLVEDSLSGGWRYTMRSRDNGCHTVSLANNQYIGLDTFPRGMVDRLASPDICGN